LPGLYIGTLKDSQDRAQLKSNHITHIVSVFEDAKENPHIKVIITYTYTWSKHERTKLY
jgi:hypothetical protein